MATFHRRGQHGRFWCPGCDDLHQVSGAWTVSGPDDAVTIQPSVLVYPAERFIDGDLDGPALFAPENRTTTPRCHSFVTDGHIEFLTDSSHALAGQTVPLADLPEWLLTE